MRPAEVGLPGVKTLYVMDFGGDYGFTARRCLLEELRASDRFIIADKEINARPTEAWAGVRGAVTSRVNDQRGVDTVTYEEVTTREVYYQDQYGQQLYDRYGNPIKGIQEIHEQRSDRVDYVIRDVSLSATATLEDVSHGLADHGSARRSSNKKYGGAQDHAKSPQYNASAPALSELGSASGELEAFACEAGRELALRYLPEQYTMKVTLDDGGGELVELGVDMAERENWPAAMDYWQRALTLDPNNAPALYDLGVGSERGGDLDGLRQAKSYYEKALAQAAEALYSDGLARIDQRIAEAEAVLRQIEE